MASPGFLRNRIPIRTLTNADTATILFLTFLSVLAGVFSTHVSGWWWIIPSNTLVSILIAWSAYHLSRHPSKLIRFLHDWYAVPIVFYVFKLTYFMVHPINPTDYDWLFISVDRWLFSLDPTRWLMQLAQPWLTELLQLCYSSYYFILLMVLIELYARRSMKEFHHALFLLIFGIYLSFMGYFVLPGVGPRFTLHDFSMLRTELPGLLLTDPVRTILDAGESISTGATNMTDSVQRDIFPSGHTQMTLIAIYIAFATKLRTRWMITVVGFFLIVATVYLRYHYVVDVIGGIVFFCCTIWSGNKLNGLWNNKERD